MNINDVENIQNLSEIDLSDNITINRYITFNVFKNIYIVLNMAAGLCNKSVCYLKLDFIPNDNFNNIYKTIYLQYDNETGLEYKQFTGFRKIYNLEKKLFNDGYIQITAYQFADYTDDNPYVIGKFRFDDANNYIKYRKFQLYKIINIDQTYKFSFDIKQNISIKSVTGSLFNTNQNYINILPDAIYINNEEEIITPEPINYVLDYTNVIRLYNKNHTFKNGSIIIYINDYYKDKFQDYDTYFCTIVFYLKNKKRYLLDYLHNNSIISPTILNRYADKYDEKVITLTLVRFKKNGNKLELDYDDFYDKNNNILSHINRYGRILSFNDKIFDINDIIKFEINYIEARNSNNESISLDNILLASQGKIINNQMIF